MNISKTERIRICQIVGGVCERYDVTPEQIASPCRIQRYYHPRAEAMLLIKDQTSLTPEHIGELFGRRAGCTVRLAIKKCRIVIAK